jgi:polyferredoxin
VWRRLSQIVFLALFAYLVMRGHGDPAVPEGWQLRSAVNPDVVFLADPLTWVLSVVASRSLIEKPIWLMLGFVALTLVLGRVFCGWICPLGTLIDGAARLLRPTRLELAAARHERLAAATTRMPPLITHRTKYYLLILLTVAALGGADIVGWFDPLAILTRATAFALYPATHWWVRTLGDAGEAWAPTAGLARPLHAWLERSFFPATPHSYGQSWLHLGILLLVLGLARLQRRWWCQYLCPLGAFYGLLARVAPLRRRVQSSDCTECGICGNACRMQAVDATSAAVTDPAECLRCMECAARCPRTGITFSFGRGSAAQGAATPADSRPFDLTRRGVLTALAGGLAAVPLVKMVATRRSPVAAFGTDVAQDEYLLRPPGARAEPAFLSMCIRCGECYRVCPQNALHPSLFEAGAEGLWTPRVVPRLGWCEPGCTLCSQVCPTTAIVPLSPTDKRRRVRIGQARIDRNRCLPWMGREECGVCEEVCPVAPKAIELHGRRAGYGAGRGRTDTDAFAVPHVVTERCIGCGICENRCPVEGQAAIRLVRHGETRHQLA